MNILSANFFFIFVGFWYFISNKLVNEICDLDYDFSLLFACFWWEYQKFSVWCLPLDSPIFYDEKLLIWSCCFLEKDLMYSLSLISGWIKWPMGRMFVLSTREFSIVPKVSVIFFYFCDLLLPSYLIDLLYLFDCKKEKRNLFILLRGLLYLFNLKCLTSPNIV